MAAAAVVCHHLSCNLILQVLYKNHAGQDLIMQRTNYSFPLNILLSTEEIYGVILWLSPEDHVHKYTRISESEQNRTHFQKKKKRKASLQEYYLLQAQIIQSLIMSSTDIADLFCSAEY
jgi:hypothetical protein